LETYFAGAQIVEGGGRKVEGPGVEKRRGEYGFEMRNGRIRLGDSFATPCRESLTHNPSKEGVGGNLGSVLKRP